jgi:hypothetical protein
VGQQSSASASRLLGQDVFEVLAAQVVGGEWQLEAQTTAGVVGACAIRVSVARMPKQGCRWTSCGGDGSGSLGSFFPGSVLTLGYEGALSRC